MTRAAALLALALVGCPRPAEPPPAAPPLGDAAGVAADEEEPFDFNVGADTAAATSVAPDDKETPVPAELPPAPAKTGKK